MDIQKKFQIKKIEKFDILVEARQGMAFISPCDGYGIFKKGYMHTPCISLVANQETSHLKALIFETLHEAEQALSNLYIGMDGNLYVKNY